MHREFFVLPVQRQAEWYDRMLKIRLDEILPKAMQQADLDMWIIICMEDAYDPVFNTMIRFRTWAPILQMLIFVRNQDDNSIRRINLSMTDQGDLYEKIWNGTNPAEQWQLLAKLVEQYNPNRIGINTGSIQWMAGGLTQNLYQQLLQSIPAQFHERLISAEVAATYWGMTLCQEEIDVYPNVVSLTKEFIADCYSPRKVIPGVTTVDDLRWNFWQNVADCGLQNSFVPFFRVTRFTKDQKVESLYDGLILCGDLIHCDVGIRYLGLCSDLQEWAYVRHSGEKDVPYGFRNLFVQANRLQQVFMSEFKHGMDGNTILNHILSRAESEGIPGPRIYSHSLGHFLHEPGPLIGLPWEQQFNPGRGEVNLDYKTAFTMELSITDTVPEWNNEPVRLSAEQDVCFTEKGCFPLAPLQTEFHLI